MLHDGGSTIKRDLTEYVLELLNNCNGSLSLAEMADDMAEAVSTIRWNVVELERDGKVTTDRGNENWEVKVV